MPWLYRTELKGIQSWILGSDKLRELVGGSTLIEEMGAFLQERAASCGGEVLSTAAGGATVRFHVAEDLARFARMWPMAVSARVPGAEQVHAWKETTGAATSEELEALARLVEAARNRRPAELPEAGPMIARSGRTGLPAVGRPQGRLADAGTRARANAAGTGRDDANELNDALGRRLLPPGSSRSFVQRDLDVSMPPGRLAVVHADGNAIGRTLIRARLDAERFRAFSDALAAATLAAASAAVGALQKRYPRADIPVRPVVLGGDDFTVIVPAAEGLPFADAFLRAFEAETARSAALDVLPDRARPFAGHTACAGVALVPRKWPFHAAHTLAESLCKGAKKALRESGRSGVAFHRVSTALSDDWDDLLQGELQTTWGARLTAGPYDLDGLARLDALATAMDDLPNGPLRGWLGQAKTDERRAQLLWERLEEVTEDRNKRALTRFQKALGDLGADPGSGWGVTSGTRHTPLGDAITWCAVQQRKHPFTRISEPSRLWRNP